MSKKMYTCAPIATATVFPHSNNRCLTVTVTVSIHQESYDGHDRYTQFINLSTNEQKSSNIQN